VIARAGGVGLDVVGAENLPALLGNEGRARQFDPGFPGRFTIHVRVEGVGFLRLHHVTNDRPDLVEIGRLDGPNDQFVAHWS
jgi:hypothetical protein